MMSVNNYYNIPNVLAGYINEFLPSEDIYKLDRLSNKTGLIFLEREFRVSIEYLSPGLQKIAQQTFLMITKFAHFSIGKKYACLSVLVGASSLSDNSTARCRRIMAANIPHFILVKCWEIRIARDFSLSEMHSSTLMTKKSFSALIQAYKNILLARLVSKPDFPLIILTEGNCPRLGPRDPSRTDYAEPMTKNRRVLAEYHTNSNHLAFNNVSLLTREVRSRTLREINTAIVTRVEGEYRLKQERIIARATELCINKALGPDSLE